MPLILLSFLLAPAEADGGKGPEFLDQVLTVYREESARLATRVAEVGEEAARLGLPQDPLAFSHPPLGRAKVVSIAGELSIRVVHQASGIAFLFLDQDRLSPEEPKLRRYLAKQHLDSGRREVRPESGRDVVYVWVKDRRVDYLDEHPRFKTMSGTGGATIVSRRLRNPLQAMWCLPGAVGEVASRPDVGAAEGGPGFALVGHAG